MTAADADPRTFHARFLFPPGSGQEENLREIADRGREAMAFLEGAGASNDAQFALNLAYEELLTNVARHVAPKSNRPVRAEFRFEILGGGGIALLCRDDGPAFDPLSAATGRAADASQGGMGLELVRRFFPGMDYRRREEWNEVLMRYHPREEAEG